MDNLHFAHFRDTLKLMRRNTFHVNNKIKSVKEGGEHQNEYKTGYWVEITNKQTYSPFYFTETQEG